MLSNALQKALVPVVKSPPLTPVLVVGAGHLGEAVTNPSRGHIGSQLRQGGFRVAGVFDADPVKVGAPIGSVRAVRPMADLPSVARRVGAQVLILAVPSHAVEPMLAAVEQECPSIKCVINYGSLGQAWPGVAPEVPVDVMEGITRSGGLTRTGAGRLRVLSMDPVTQIRSHFIDSLNIIFF